MKITIINNDKGEKRYTREELDEFVAQLKDGTFRHHITRIVCGFLPAGRRMQGRRILYDFSEGVKAVWQKGFKP